MLGERGRGWWRGEWRRRTKAGSNDLFRALAKRAEAKEGPGAEMSKSPSIPIDGKSSVVGWAMG